MADVVMFTTEGLICSARSAKLSGALSARVCSAGTRASDKPSPSARSRLRDWGVFCGDNSGKAKAVARFNTSELLLYDVMGASLLPVHIPTCVKDNLLRLQCNSLGNRLNGL